MLFVTVTPVRGPLKHLNVQAVLVVILPSVGLTSLSLPSSSRGRS